MLKPALDLLRELRQLGAEIETQDSALQVIASAGVLTDEIKQQLAFRKTEMLALFAHSIRLLNRRGVRLINRDGRTVLALWRDADGREVRDALEAVGHDGAEVLYLDDPEADVPERYRQFVPEYVKAIWARAGLLATPTERLEAEAKARHINRLFDALGTSPRPSRITGATVLHGLLKKRKSSAL